MQWEITINESIILKTKIKVKNFAAQNHDKCGNLDEKTNIDNQGGSVVKLTLLFEIYMV